MDTRQVEAKYKLGNSDGQFNLEVSLGESIVESYNLTYDAVEAELSKLITNLGLGIDDITDLILVCTPPLPQ